MLKKLKELIRGADSAADIRAALRALDDAPHEAAMAEARSRRAALLLEGDDAAVLAAEREMDAARIAIDRNAAAREALAPKLAEAEEREAEAAFREAFDAAVAMREAAVKRISVDYARAAKTIVSVIEDANAADQAIEAIADADLERYGAVRPKAVGPTVWGEFYLPGVTLAEVTLPPTRSSPAIGRIQHAPQLIQPVLGA